MTQQIIDEMPTLTEVENADRQQIVKWHLFLRPTMSNDELPIIKKIAQRYEQIPSEVREGITMRLRTAR